MSEVLGTILKSKIVAIIRTDDSETAYKSAKAIWQGGIKAVEVTLNVPGALGVIEKLRKDVSEGCLIGVGTVLDAESCVNAIRGGAQFIVSPNINKKVIQTANRYNVPVLPGAQTVTEILTALEYGADVVKIFPASILSPAFIKAVKAPLPFAKLMATGGVNLDNAQAWLREGSDVLGVGGGFTASAKSGNYQGVTDMAKKFTEAVKLDSNRI